MEDTEVSKEVLFALAMLAGILLGAHGGLRPYLPPCAAQTEDSCLGQGYVRYDGKIFRAE